MLAELKAGRTRAGRLGWGWVNKPITLWALSTVAVGLLSFVYSHFTDCTRRLETDIARYERLFSELATRTSTLYGIVYQQDAPPTAGLMMALDPGQTYVYAEFKDKSVIEISEEARLIFRRWHPFEYGMWSDIQAHTVPDAVAVMGRLKSDPKVLEGEGFGPAFETITRMLAAPGVKMKQDGVAGGRLLAFLDQLSVWPIAQKVLQLKPSAEFAAPIAAWARTLGADAMELARNDGEFFLGSPAACARQALLPF